MKKTAFILLVVSCVVFGVVTTANAFWEGQNQQWGATGNLLNPKATTSCDSNVAGVTTGCHGNNSSTAYGPHGNFTDSTDSCRSCHDVHEAASDTHLLPASTVVGVCVSCHDFSWTGSGGSGVYGSLRARSQAVAARHNILGYQNDVVTGVATDTWGPKTLTATSTIPGGGAASLGHILDCTDCHTPHGSTSIATWANERIRSTNPPQTSNHLLKDNLLGTSHGTYTVYGSNWCAACHKNRHDDSFVSSTINNHPVDTGNAAVFAVSQADQGLNWHATVAQPNSMNTTHQAGWSREATSGWKPECQQCHYNTRNNTGGLKGVESPYSVTDRDGLTTSDNPRWGTFPHESQGVNFLVETGDDLCLNCHATNALP